jgi:hypothetical protein
MRMDLSPNALKLAGAHASGNGPFDALAVEFAFWLHGRSCQQLSEIESLLRLVKPAIEPPLELIEVLDPRAE